MIVVLLWFSIFFQLRNCKKKLVKKANLIRNKKKKLNRIVLLARPKLNNIEKIISKALTDADVSLEQITIITNEADKYRKLKAKQAISTDKLKIRETEKLIKKKT